MVTTKYWLAARETSFGAEKEGPGPECRMRFCPEAFRVVWLDWVPGVRTLKVPKPFFPQWLAKQQWVTT